MGIAYSDFGHTSLLEFVKNKKTLALKSGRALWLENLLGLLQLPGLLMSLTIVGMIYLMFYTLNWHDFVLANAALLIAGSVYFNSRARSRFPLASMKFSRSFLDILYLVNLPTMIIAPKFESWFNDHPTFSAGLYSMVWILVLAFSKVHFKVSKEMKTQYPQAFA